MKRSYYGLNDNYRIYGWINQNRHTDLGDPTRDNLSNQGFGMSLDQRVASDVALFARYGIRDGNVSKFDQAATVGGQIIGNGWRRANDVIGVAYGLSKTSSKYKDSSLALDGYEAKGDEQYMEAYYRYWANSNLSISPDLQYVVSPGGDKEKSDIFIYGARMQLTF